MERTRKTRELCWALVLTGTLAFSIAGCGEEDFKNEPRAPVAIELTGVIQEGKVTISPNGRRKELGAGPFLITISNQTKQSHTLTLEGEDLRVRVPPVRPLDTATIQKTLPPGDYEVRAGSSVAVAKEIQPGELIVGKERKDSNNRLLLP